ncbi:hypothetical protein VCHC62B1_3184 [Vibrio cholerae HC-62B1]|nr:hypothetical protein VCHC62B1_3184 [Vibrio cholerae HC-62B1]CSA54167.1 Uncharacterised protein [Vibrio cholerae]
MNLNITTGIYAAQLSELQIASVGVANVYRTVEARIFNNKV